MAAETIKSDAPETKRPYRALALDGGGMRGLYTTIVLDALVQQFSLERGVSDLDVGKGFDLIAGTSTGSILACALACGRSTREVIDFYTRYAPAIFERPTPDSGSLAKTLGWIWRSWSSSSNDGVALSAALGDALGEETLRSVYERRGIALCVPAVTMSTRKSKVFKTPHDARRQLDAQQLLVDVCRASCAAPVIFPIACVEDQRRAGSQVSYADGGLWANNPTLVALIEALQLANDDQDIEVLSISTCASPEGNVVGSESCSWGLSKWRFGIEMLGVSMEAQASGVENIVKFLLPHLKKPCSVVRLPFSPPSPDQYQHLGIDRATPKAIQVLMDLGRDDAGVIHSEYIKGDVRVKSFFDLMPAR